MTVFEGGEKKQGQCETFQLLHVIAEEVARNGGSEWGFNLV
jgi:hypothetical protein